MAEVLSWNLHGQEPKFSEKSVNFLQCWVQRWLKEKAKQHLIMVWFTKSSKNHPTDIRLTSIKHSPDSEAVSEAGNVARAYRYSFSEATETEISEDAERSLCRTLIPNIVAIILSVYCITTSIVLAIQHMHAPVRDEAVRYAYLSIVIAHGICNTLVVIVAVYSGILIKRKLKLEGSIHCVVFLEVLSSMTFLFAGIGFFFCGVFPLSWMLLPSLFFSIKIFLLLMEERVTTSGKFVCLLFLKGLCSVDDISAAFGPQY